MYYWYTNEFTITKYGWITPYSEDKDLVYKDAVFFSMHKFVGGVDSPGKEYSYLLCYWSLINDP